MPKRVTISNPPATPKLKEPPSTIADPKLAPPKTKIGEIPAERVKTEEAYPDEAVDALKRVLRGITAGEDLKDSEPMIARLVANQEARAKVINSLIMTHDYERLVRFIDVRKNMDRVIIDAAANKELKWQTAVNLYKLVTLEVEEISGRMRAQMMGNTEMLNLIQKVGWATDMDDMALADKLKGTSPQGREIIRRVAYKLKKAADAAVSKSDSK